MEKNLQSVKNILENERNVVDIRNTENRTPLMCAIQYCIKKPEIIKQIMRYQPNKNLIDNNKFSALHLACLYNNFEIIPKIITEENVNIKNIDGNTPLMIAIKKNHYNCVNKLLECDIYINVNIPD
ncbi:ankyrin, partial [Piromyces finnis]